MNGHVRIQPAEKIIQVNQVRTLCVRHTSVRHDNYLYLFVMHRVIRQRVPSVFYKFTECDVIDRVDQQFPLPAVAETAEEIYELYMWYYFEPEVP